MIKVEEVSYVYQTKYQKIEAVKNVSCNFDERKLYALVGESGSGKSTLLSLLAGLDLPTQGKIYIEDKDIASMNRDEYRLNMASVVYQAFHLFPLLTALENVMFPMEFKKYSKKEAKEQAQLLLNKVGLGEKIYSQYPQMMSGGEQQRVAIARAMASGGKIILADEPTGNLDTENEKNIVEQLKWLAHEEGYTVIVITHNTQVAKEADVIFRMRDGYLSEAKE
jgi:ABC-type lipoprotein export system ATPase subunit